MDLLTIELLVREAKDFAQEESTWGEPSLYGVTDGKAVGTYLEHKFQSRLSNKYTYVAGSSAKGIDLPKLQVDLKVTSKKQPQSSCPFKSARQKIYGLGYNLLVFVYEKMDDHEAKKAQLNMMHVIFVDAEKTADYQLTRAVMETLQRNGNKDDLLALFEDKNLPVDEIEGNRLAEEILNSPPDQGYLTISNALQWRLQYNRVISVAGQVEGVKRVR